jgi:hypothetical protein
MAWVLILGSTSDIARATARKFAENGFDLYLAGRDKRRIERDAEDITIRTGRVAKVVEFDAANYGTHKKFYDSLKERPDVVLCAFGYLGDQQRAQSDFAEASRIIESNFTGAVSILNRIADDFEKLGRGTIIGISSVAGDRGRGSNYMYGSAKAGFTAYLSGLRNRLQSAGVHVVTVKPGFVRTRMTEKMDLPGALTAEPERVAADIYNAYLKKRNIIYTLWYWRFIMLIIRHIPERIFKKLSL